MLTFSLQSGSNGNAIYVEAGDVRLLFDAGLSGRLAEERMRRHGRHIRDCQALIISHDHWDHTKGAGVFQRRFRLPIYITQGAYRAVRHKIGAVGDARFYAAGDRLQFGDVTVHTVPTPHDGIDTVCFVVEHEDRKLGILTDLGHPFRALSQVLAEVDAAYLESNYDVDMLFSGPYPERLKRRIAGKGGHLSNEEAAVAAQHSINGRMQWLAVAHLSEQNNRPELALETARRRVGKYLPIHLASRYETGEALEV